MLHRNAKLTPAGRRLLVDRIASGRPVAHVAAEMGVARQTAHRWWRRFVAEGESGLQDRSCRPRRSPRRTPRALERRIERLRRRQKLGPVRIGYRLGLAASTVYRVLCRLGLQWLSWLDRPTGRVIRRYEHPHPGDLLHMDIKKLGGYPRAEAGVHTAGVGPGRVSGSGTPTSTPPSTTTPASPTARYWLTSGRSPWWRSGGAPWRGSPTVA